MVFLGKIHRKSPQIANYYGDSELYYAVVIFSTAGSFGQSALESALRNRGALGTPTIGAKMITLHNLGGFKSFKRSFSLEPNNLLAVNLAIRAAFETAILSVRFGALSVRFGGLSVRFRGISVGFRLLLITK